MNQTSLRTATLALLLAGGSTTAPAAVVYTQPPQSPVVSVRASQFLASSGGFTFQTFDNFSLTTGTSLTDVHWQGAYFNTLIDPTAPPTAPNSTGFGVQFFSDAGGLPGGLLASHVFTPAGANETFLGTQFAPNLNLTVAIFDYDVLLSLPFAAAANTTYWLSTYAFSPAPSATEAQWGWTGGLPGDGTSVQNGNIVNFDRAFDLTTGATEVPEPSTLLLLLSLIGLTGLAVRPTRTGDMFHGTSLTLPE